MWMVSGTTRNLSLASIITARRAPVRMGKEFGMAGKAESLPLFSTALWMGAVTTAAASPGKAGFDRDLDGFDHRGGIGGIWLAW